MLPGGAGPAHGCPAKVCGIPHVHEKQGLGVFMENCLLLKSLPGLSRVWDITDSQPGPVAWAQPAFRTCLLPPSRKATL